MKKNKTILWLALVTVLTVCLLAGALVLSLLPGKNLTQGKTYLKDQSELDLTQLETSVNTVRAESWSKAVANGTASIYSAFADAVILGDSRADGFKYYGFLPESQVLTGVGDSIFNVKDNLDAIAAAQPSWVYIIYGTNDALHALGGNEENGYADLVKEQVDSILEVSPASKIVLSSIIEVTPDKAAEDAAWQNIAAYNEQLKALCEEQGWIFVDNSTITQNGTADIYQDDGIHFSADFYPVWAENLIMAAMYA